MDKFERQGKIFSKGESIFSRSGEGGGNQDGLCKNNFENDINSKAKSEIRFLNTSFLVQSILKA